MFRKHEVEPTMADKLIETKNIECSESWNAVYTKARRAYIIEQAVNLYAVDTADRKAEEKELEDARYSLLCSIGEYDSRTNELKKLFDKYPVSERVTTKDWEISYPSSHELVRRSIENFIGRK